MIWSTNKQKLWVKQGLHTWISHQAKRNNSFKNPKRKQSIQAQYSVTQQPFWDKGGQKLWHNWNLETDRDKRRNLDPKIIFEDN